MRGARVGLFPIDLDFIVPGGDFIPSTTQKYTDIDNA